MFARHLGTYADRVLPDRVVAFSEVLKSAYRCASAFRRPSLIALELGPSVAYDTITRADRIADLNQALLARERLALTNSSGTDHFLAIGALALLLRRILFTKHGVHLDSLDGKTSNLYD